MDQKRLAVALALIIASLAACVAWGAAPTGDEILVQVDQQGEFLGEGSLVTTLRFETVYADGTSSTNLFGALGNRREGGPEYSLVYFLEPADLAGTIFLSAKKAGEEARLWLYLPALGLPKELVSEEEKEDSFAGSAISYQDIGGRDLAGKYRAEIVREEDLTVGNLVRSVYVLSLTARPGATSDSALETMWVDKEEYILLRAESRSASGVLERVVEFAALGRFEGRLTADRIVARDFAGGSTTTITFLERRRPAIDLPDGLFDPGSLATFDPAAYGLTAR
jgi:hypothetical protein